MLRQVWLQAQPKHFRLRLIHRTPPVLTLSMITAMYLVRRLSMGNNDYSENSIKIRVAPKPT